MSTELILGLVYGIPLLFILLHARVLSNAGKKDDTLFVLGIVPVLNIMFIFYCLGQINDYPSVRVGYKRMFSNLFNFKSMSDGSNESIKLAKENMEKEIKRIKEEYKNEVVALKREDKQKKLLSELGLSLEDLEYLKANRARGGLSGAAGRVS